MFRKFGGHAYLSVLGNDTIMGRNDPLASQIVLVMTTNVSVFTGIIRRSLSFVCTGADSM